MKRITFITGTRADWGKLKPLVEAVSQDHDVKIFATGMHMQDKYGMTCHEITKAGYEYYPYINQTGGMDTTLASTITGLSCYLKENETDMLVVHGDRVEALAGACVGALNNILVAHIEGGELSGTIDESIRHAVSKLAHVHFVANLEAAERLAQMGEDNIHIIGSPDIDVMLSNDLPSIQEVKAHYDIPFETYSICLYHPVTTEEVDLTIFDALERSSDNFVMIYPNNDTGSEKILERMKQYQGERFKTIPSMRFEYFLTLLKNAKYIIGNSSAGIREAPVYGVPTINIGTRQEGRTKGKTIITCTDLYSIMEAMDNLPPREPEMRYGDGKSGERFREIIDTTWNIPIQKRFLE